MRQSLLVLLTLVFVSLNGCAAQDKTARNIEFGPAPEGVVKAMSFNIRVGTANDGPNHWNLRKEAVYDLLAQSKMDVIGMQEVQDFQLAQLKKALPQYKVISASAKKGEGGENCSVFYRADRFKLKDSGTFWFSDTPDARGSSHWGNKFPRICTWAHLAEKATGKSFYIYNLHLDHQSQPSRVMSTKLLTKQIAERKTQDPYFIMGDYNMRLDNPGMLYLQKIGFESPYPKLTDVWQLANPDKKSPGTAHGFRGNTDGNRIDHIMVTDDIKVLESAVLTGKVNGRYPSDHYPITATLKLY